jgi:tetratricopeptide (TPR) repeat protein
MHKTTAVIAATLLAAQAFAHEDDAKPASGQALGKVTFKTSCGKAVQPKFDRGVALLHSFWYSEGEAAFKEIAAQEPGCTMAYWGLASILMNNPIAGQGAVGTAPERAQAALEQARANPAKTQRERDYLEAVSAYYKDFAQRTERERQQARADAYEKLAAKYPQDDEAQIFYAVYLAATQPLTDKTYGPTLKAAAILEKQFKKYPQHPGVAHYLIHSYDYPPIAQKGVSAARRYAKIAPDAPHAQHMPSHIFTRVGAWEEAAQTNARSASAARKGNEGDESWHAVDYMVYAYLQMGRDRQAEATWSDALKYMNISPRFVAPYAISAVPARLAIERGDWKAAAALEPKSTKFPFVDATTHFARALGNARSGNAEAAEQELRAIAKLHAQLVEAKNGYWATEVEVSGLAALAWTRLAQGKADEAEERMRQAADMEDKNDKHIVTPGRILPARELLGDLLLEMKRPADALKEYEASQQREPNRFRGLYGAAQAAEQAGDRAKAKRYYAQLVKVAGKGDVRPELAAAKKYLALK